MIATTLTVGQRVTYSKSRATQHIDGGIRDAHGTVRGFETHDHEPCALVAWDWAPNTTFAVNVALLELAKE